MNTLDIIILVPAIWLAYRGFSKGLILTLTSLVALIAGIYFSIHFAGFVADWLREDNGFENRYINIISFAIVFAATVIVIQLIGKLFDKVANWAALGFLNRLAGLALGLIKAVLFLGITLFIINNFDTHNKIITPKMQSGSYFYEPLSGVVPRIWPVVRSWLPEKEIKEKPKIPAPVIEV